MEAQQEVKLEDQLEDPQVDQAHEERQVLKNDKSPFQCAVLVGTKLIFNPLLICENAESDRYKIN